MKKSLLIISCSGAKNKALGMLPALMRYKGPFYLTLHKAIRENRLPKSLDILIISAKYGLLRSDEPIPYYDLEMTPEIADELRASIQEKLKAFLYGKDYDQLFDGLWQVYKQTLEGFELERHFRYVVPVETNRLKKRSQLKAWIIELKDISG